MQKVITSFGQLLGNEKLTLEETATQLGLTSERVRQIEKSALSKMKRKLEAYGVYCLTDICGSMTFLEPNDSFTFHAPNRRPN
jgi:hypothetical protein